MRTGCVELSRLGPMQELDSGGFATVYRLSSYTLAGFAGLAYKHFTSPPDPDEVANLVELVRFRSALDAGSRAILDDAAAWPLQLVTDAGQVCGFVMQLIPPEFFGRQLLPSGNMVDLPVKSQWLVVDSAKADAAGLAVPRGDDVAARLVLCAKLAHALGVLHRAGLVYGDLSLNNVVFSAACPPRVMLVDCDAVQAPRSAPITQSHTDDWAPPECASGRHVQDIETDRYKLALFILRALTPGPHASQSTDPGRVVGVLDLAGNTLMRAGLSAERRTRPSAKDWYAYLTGYLHALTSPPEFTEVGVDAVAALAGSTVTVRWQATGATRVEVTASDGHTTVCDNATGAGRCRIAVTRTGAFTLRAVNPYGTTIVDTHSVHVLQPPTIRRIDVPQVALPRIETAAAGLGAGLAGLRRGVSIPPDAFALPDLSPLQAMAPRCPDVLSGPLPPGGWIGGQASAAHQVRALLAGLSADARAVAEHARSASPQTPMRGIGC